MSKLTAKRKMEIVEMLHPSTLSIWAQQEKGLVWCYGCGEDFEPLTEPSNCELAFCPLCHDRKPVFNPCLALGYLPSAMTGRGAKAGCRHTAVDFEPDDEFGKPRSAWEIPFGKYRGTSLESVPDAYLKWLLEQEWMEEKYPNERELVEGELEYREKWGLHVKDGERKDEYR